MPTTRSSARKSGATSPPSSSPPSRSGSKRKAESSPASKVKATQAPKKQKTIEETLPDAPADEPAKAPESNEPAASKPVEASNDVEMKDAEVNGKPESIADEKSGDATVSEPTSKDSTSQSDSAPKAETNGDGSGESKPEPKTDEQADKEQATAAPESSTNNASKDDSKATANAATASTAEPAPSSNTADQQKATPNTDSAEGPSETKPADGDAVEKSSQREKSTPSSILEKGIIYFFFRGRVGIDDPSNVNDIARSYIVLRPLPRGAKLTDGSLGDQNNLRVLALPKKVLPKSPKDRFMVFVEKSKVNLEDLKKEFLSSSDYETKTAGTRHTPAATPIGEGVYALTSTGRETHLAYVLTIPKELSEVQKDIGLESKGSWVTSVKNPQHAGPAQAQLPNDPKFPQEILDEFRSLRWGQLQPKHLDYENCQLLVIGHKDNSFAKATENDDKEVDPKEELEKLGEEEEHRVEHLDGDDTVFEDLNIDAKDYPSVQTTW